jgi:hypothetical protein
MDKDDKGLPRMTTGVTILIVIAVIIVLMIIFACTRKCPICGGRKWGSHAFNCPWGKM